MPKNGKRRVSLGKRFRSCSSFCCVGVAPNWGDYPSEIREVISESQKIYYPSPLYNDIFIAVGKETYPRNYYDFLGNKINQTELFQLLGISHPRTRLYYGRSRLSKIVKDFEYPFIAKTPVGSSKGEGIFLIDSEDELTCYLRNHQPAYIQEYLPIDRDLRVVLINGAVINAYWRIHRPGEFRNNVSRGASVSYESIPKEALEFAEDVSRRCRFDDVGLDICLANGLFYVLEANMVFGFEGFRKRGLDLYEIISDMSEKGKL
jgi:ribosomal protein S6--L-glutamate ligase